MARKKMSFEDSIKRLDEIVVHLEKGDIPLQESIALFDEGTKLLADCSQMLDEAEQTVVKIRKGSDGEPEELPLTSQQCQATQAGKDPEPWDVEE